MSIRKRNLPDGRNRSERLCQWLIDTDSSVGYCSGTHTKWVSRQNTRIDHMLHRQSLLSHPWKLHQTLQYHVSRAWLLRPLGRPVSEGAGTAWRCAARFSLEGNRKRARPLKKRRNSLPIPRLGWPMRSIQADEDNRAWQESRPCTFTYHVIYRDPSVPGLRLVSPSTAHRRKSGFCGKLNGPLN